MQSLSNSSLRLGVMTAALLASMALAACNKAGEPTVGQRVDGAIADTKQATTGVRASAMDATITTKINAALAADDKLSAIKINVDTANGRVTLSGTAPDTTSRERATTLATAVDGVTAVDNRLSVSGS